MNFPDFVFSDPTRQNIRVARIFGVVGQGVIKNLVAGFS